MPMGIVANGELYTCVFSGTLEIVAVKNSYAFLIGTQQSFWMVHPWGFLLGKSWGNAGLSKPFAVIVGKEPSHFMVSQLKVVLLGKEL